MSAIFGIIYKDGKPAEQQEADVLHASISHRATDGKGTWLEDNVVLGHCLLKTFPQQEFEKQPQQLDSSIITADARLDNRSDLATWFGIDKQLLAITPDPTLILYAYRRWGKDCVKYLQGEFAFAIWDIRSRTLFAATDAIGFRPFFYYNSPDIFIFCSEIKGVVAAKPLPNYFNEESLIEYFYRKGSPLGTYNKEVFDLCGGNTLTLQDSNVKISKYWYLESTGKYSFKKDEDWYDCTRELLYQAVEKRLNPEVPIGITLSGGLDSTSIACVLSELLLKKNKPLYAFSSVLPIHHAGIETDERRYIEMVSKQCPNIIQTYEEAPGVGPLSDLEEAFNLDEAFPNPFFYMDKALLEAASKKNVKILFNGYGGDYWISSKGGRVIYDLINSRNLGTAYKLLKQFSEKEKATILHELKVRYLIHTKVYTGIKSIVKKKEADWQIKSFLHESFLQGYSAPLGEKYDTRNSILMKHLFENGNIGKIIARLTNRNSWYGIDSSVPLFDKELMEFLVHVPERLFVEKGTPRNLIRSAMSRVIPAEICQRTDKQPYSPGCPARMISQKEQLLQIVNKPNKQESFAKYIHTDAVIDHFDEISPYLGFGRSDKIIYIRVAQAGIACSLLDKLYSIGYRV